jgi:7-carboxy-7-deazaguanine synthase
MPDGQPEIFSSIQGEGISVGVPSTFIRFSLCNLKCTWCDTAYTWDWTKYDPIAETTILAVGDVLRRVEMFRNQNVVITGGEPLVQQAELEQLATMLRGGHYRVEVETNGTLIPRPETSDHVDQWNVSPKLASSGNDEKQRLRPLALAWFAEQSNAYFKFVVTGPSDVDEVQSMMNRLTVPPKRVLLMAEGRSVAEQLEKARWLVPACQATGYRYSPRLHILLWGDERGR